MLSLGDFVGEGWHMSPFLYGFRDTGFFHSILPSCVSPFWGMAWISIQNKDDAWRILGNRWYWDKHLISIE
jgi:hypothetical protein